MFLDIYNNFFLCIFLSEMIDSDSYIENQNKVDEKLLLHLRRHYSVLDGRLKIRYVNGHEAEVPISENKKWLKSVLFNQCKEKFTKYPEPTINKTIKEYLNNNLN